MEILIRKFTDGDLDQVMDIWNDVIDEGKCFYWKEHFSKDYVSYIIDKQDAVFCAVHGDLTIGFYILHANSPGRGSHIANALYAVKKEYRGTGTGRKLAEHSMDFSRGKGYKAMQFNGVVSDNIPSIRLWESLGFERIGTVSDAFVKDNGDAVDVYLYYKRL
jgi:L-amino acid N-acyltransferase YncA